MYSGKVVRVALAYPDTHTALKAVGLAKEAMSQANIDARAYAGAMADDDVMFAMLDYEHVERFQTLRRELGVDAFGINLLLFAPGERGRIHSHDSQEEVYLVLAGELTLVVERVEHVLAAKRVARVAPGVRRQLVNAGAERLVLLALGGAGEHVGRDGRA
jgi:mannose-6-phosphate isomerase-like protein (cupin superfamily)